MIKTTFKFVLPIDDITNLVKGYCGIKGFNYEEKEIEKGRRIEISNLKEKLPINIYQTGTVLLQGKDGDFKNTIAEFLVDAEGNPGKYLQQQVISAEAYRTRVTIYKIANKDLQKDIESTIKTKGFQIHDLKPPERQSIKYRFKVQKFQFQAVVTQFDNGTLVIQGRNDFLWDEICSVIEERAQFSVGNIAARFVSKSEKEATNIIHLLTDELIFIAEDEIQSKIGETYAFLDEWDRKYLVSAFCLLHLNLTLPEYSSVVMPASKCFEGFLKKLLIEIRLCTKSEVQQAGWDLGSVWRKSKYEAYAKTNKLRRPELVKLENALSRFRNYMMHSSSAVLTQVTDNRDAELKLNEIVSTINDAYQFFVIRKGKS